MEILKKLAPAYKKRDASSSAVIFFDEVLACLAESPPYLRRKYPKNLDFSYAFS
jgi:hypothetical protein